MPLPPPFSGPFRATTLLGVIAIVAACIGPGASQRPAAPDTTLASPSPSPSVSPGGSSGGSPERTVIEFDADGPLGLDVRDSVAWVSAYDSGEVVAVDLETNSRRAFTVGNGGVHLLATAGGPVLVAGIDDAPGGTLLVVDPASGDIEGLAVGPLAGLGLDGDGRVWALGSLGEILVIDAGRAAVVGRTSIEVNALEHLDGVFGAGAFWASSDTTPVRRLEGEAPAVVAEIETGGGIPLVFVDGLVWGARADELWAIDPATDEVTRRIPLEGLIEILDLDVSGGVAWIAGRKPGRVGVVVGIDLASGSILGQAPVSLPAGVAIAGDRVWVTDYETDELVGIDRR